MSTFDLWYLWYERVKIERKHLTLPKIWLDYKNLSCVLVFFQKNNQEPTHFFYLPKSWTNLKKSWGRHFRLFFMSRGVGAMIRFHENKKCATNTRTFIMGFAENRGTPKSSILIGLSIINHPFWGIPIFGNTHMHGTLCYPRSIRTPMETPLEVWFLHHPVGSLRITAWAPWGLRLARQRWEC